MKTFLFSISLITLSAIFNSLAQSYYPLEIGNEWIFYDSTYYYGGYEIDTTIIKVIDDSTFSNGKTYFVLDGPDFVDARYVRSDSLGIYYYDTWYFQDETLFYRFDLPIDSVYNVNLGVYFYASRIAEGQYSIFNVPFTWQEFYLDGLAVCYTVLSDKFGPIACLNLHDPPGMYTTERYLIGAIISDTVYGFVPIPVEMTSFTASLNNLNQVVLNWMTATETNNKGFEVQRSEVSGQQSTANNWEKIGFVEGNGTTMEKHMYNFVDKDVHPAVYVYRLKQVDFAGSFKYSKEVEVEVKAPLQFSLEQNYPNPFNAATLINYQLPLAGVVTLKIYDVLGIEVATLVNEQKNQGRYSVNFDASSLASGVYIYRLRVNDYISSKKMLLLK